MEICKVLFIDFQVQGHSSVLLKLFIEHLCYNIMYYTIVSLNTETDANYKTKSNMHTRIFTPIIIIKSESS